MTVDFLNVAIVQTSMQKDIEKNLKNTSEAIRTCAAQQAELILLPELFRTVYFCQSEQQKFFSYAETIPGPTTEMLSQLAKELKVILVTSIFEKRLPGLYHNTAVVIDKTGEIAGIYRKMHIPDDPGYYEKYYFTPGDLGFEPISVHGLKLGVLICWDQWFPEAARLMALKGAELLLYPTAIGWNPKDVSTEQMRQQDAWFTIQRGHAIANGIPVLSANRVGFEKDPSQVIEGIQFWGHSFIAGQQGEILAKASSDHPDILFTPLDLNRSQSVRHAWPYLRDRRIDAYQGLCRIADTTETKW